MLKYRNKDLLVNWFGDFSGDCFTDEFEDRETLNSRIREILGSDLFEQDFMRTLQLFDCDQSIVRHVLGDLEIYSIKNNACAYAAAGQLALTKALGKSKAVLGVFPYLKDISVRMAEVAREVNVPVKLVLCKELAEDREYVETLGSKGVETDTKMWEELNDLVSFNAASAAFMEEGSMQIFLTANGEIPYAPAIVSDFTGLYGEAIKEKADQDFDCVLAPIIDGTNALSLFGSYEGSAKLISVEYPVAQEYHDGVTLVTRGSKEGYNTILCPELCNMWHEARVVRLGCDRYRKVDTGRFEEFSDAEARALALCIERYPFRKILLVEE